jgi:hypothetical protein
MLQDTWTRVASAVALVMVIALTGSAMAAAKQSFPLMGQEDSPKAKGTAVIQDNRLTVTANGLKPNAVYTVWFVNMQPTMTQEGAGSPPFTFKTDGKGRAGMSRPSRSRPLGSGSPS